MALTSTNFELISTSIIVFLSRNLDVTEHIIERTNL